MLKYGADVNLSVFAFLCTKTLCRFFGGFCELLLVEVVADHLSGPDRVIKPVYVCLWVWTISFELNDLLIDIFVSKLAQASCLTKY